MKRPIQVIVLILILSLVGCNKAVDISGTVVDGRTKKPIAKALVVAGTLKATTDDHGKFRLTAVPKTARVTISAANYKVATSSVGANSFTLIPIPVTGTVTSNLEGQGIAATVVAREEFQAAADGKFTVFDVGPGDEITLRYQGYEEQKAKVGPDRSVSVVLLADPSTTYKQIFEKWNGDRNYDNEWDWVHPDAYAYISKEEFVRTVSKDKEAGYSIVSVDIHEVTFTTWDFVCKVGGKVVVKKTYANTATLRTTDHLALPNGGGREEQGVHHLAKTADGKWAWFPLGGKCD